MEFSNEQLKKIQETELELLIKFDEICKLNGIKYQLFAGTLLGAVRHKGFIPWDDDVDVCMTRSEYDKFLSVCTPDILGDKYFLQTNETDSRSVIQFAKLRKNGTLFESVNEVNEKTHKGVYIDIFPFDNVKLDTREGKKQIRKYRFYYALITSGVPSRIKNSGTLFVKLCRCGLFLISKIITKKRLDKKLDKITRKFNGEKTDYVDMLVNGSSQKEIDRWLIRTDVFNDLAEYEFEGQMFSGPKDYDTILKHSYGDYMTPPPIEEQKPHHDIVTLKLD